MLRLGRDANGKNVSGLGTGAFALHSKGGLATPSDSSDSENASGMRGGTADVEARLSEVVPETSVKPRARQGCKCFPPVSIAALLVCKLGEGLNADDVGHPGM